MIGLHCSENIGSRRDMTLGLACRLATSCWSSLERRSEACGGVQEVEEEPEVGVIVVDFIELTEQTLHVGGSTILLRSLPQLLLGKLEQEGM